MTVAKSASQAINDSLGFVIAGSVPKPIFSPCKEVGQIDFALKNRPLEVGILLGESRTDLMQILDPRIWIERRRLGSAYGCHG